MINIINHRSEMTSKAFQNVLGPFPIANIRIGKVSKKTGQLSFSEQLEILCNQN